MGRPDDDKFEILNLGSQPCCKPLKSPKSSPKIYAVWTIDLGFQYYGRMPHPNSRHGCPDMWHKNMHITNIHGRRLSFVQIEITDLVANFNIWTLDMKYSATGQQQPNWNYNFELRTLRLIWKFYPKRFQLIYEFSPYVPTLVLE